MASTAPLLVLRFSALGDVAMTVPVLRALLQQHPDVRVCMVSDRAYACLFEGIDRLTFFGADLKGEHRGLLGLVRLFFTLRKAGSYSAVADLHHVIRTRVLRVLFLMSGVRGQRLDKGREQKRQLTRRYQKVRGALPSGFERMRSVFEQLGFSMSLPSVSTAIKITGDSPMATARPLRIGVAPFARHPEKTYPIEQMKKVVALLQERAANTILLFGASGAEAASLAAWQKEFAQVHSMAGRGSLREELVQISQLDVMLCMDSANMHLASLYNVPVVSIWGATHPDAGFMGWGQPLQSAVQIELSCRPCSVFGNKPCFRGDQACMRQITPAAIVERLYRVVSQP